MEKKWTKGVITRVSEHADQIDKKEWDNLQEFLRILYKASDDMKSITKASIYDPEKKKKAEEDIKLLQKFTQLGDNPVSKQDAPGYAEIIKKCVLIIDNFFDLLRDVPDEIWLFKLYCMILLIWWIDNNGDFVTIFT